ncbi:semaphorin-2A-like [Glandiceps talaboti]
MMKTVGTVILAVVVCMESVKAVKFGLEDSDLTTYTNGDIAYYKTLYPMGDRLYMGAVYKTSNEGCVIMAPLDDITSLCDSGKTCELSIPIIPDPRPLDCSDSTQNAEYDCKNHIKVILQDPTDTDNLLVCGTNLGYQRCYFVSKAGDTLSLVDESDPSFDGERKCPLSPDVPVTAVFGQNKKVFSATTYKATGDVAISRGPANGVHDIETSADGKWVSRPAEFIDSYSLGKINSEFSPTVLFFYRETVNEITTQYPEALTYSRISKVCEDDVGGNDNALKMQWSSFLKARLDCSLPEDSDELFRTVYDVLEDTDDVDYDSDTTYFGVFTRNRNGVSEPALCSFKLSKIKDLFNVDTSTKYVDQLDPANTASLWGDVPTTFDPAPGACQSTTPDEDTLKALKSHPLLSNNLKSEGAPQLIDSYIGVKFTKIVSTQVGGDIILFIGTDKGTVLKVLYNDNDNTAKVLQEMQVSSKEKISVMEYSGDYLYIGFDDRVVQLSMKLCNKYLAFPDECNMDPHCIFHENECKDKSDVTGAAQVSADTKKVKCQEGQNKVLSCPIQDTEWKKDNQALNTDGSKSQVINGVGLLIKNCEKADKGIYTSGSCTIELTVYSPTCGKDEIIKSCQGRTVNVLCCSESGADTTFTWKDPKGVEVTTLSGNTLAWAKVVEGNECVHDHVSWLVVEVSIESNGTYTCEGADGTKKTAIIELDSCVNDNRLRCQQEKYKIAEDNYKNQPKSGNQCNIAVIDCDDCCPEDTTCPAK